ncbi:MAG: SLC13 family permease [Bacteroidia bacterium]|nr:SLC13 family permease [Bacteroidia bacterium]
MKGWKKASIALGSTVLAIGAGYIGYKTGLNAVKATALGVLTLMALWWLTGTVPYYVVATVPALSVPILDGVGLPTASSLWKAYGQPVLGLFLGSFWLARAVEVHGVGSYLRDRVLYWSRGEVRRIFRGLSVLAAALSTLLNNTAVTALMLPLVSEIMPPGEPRWRLALSIAWATSIGGVATLTGSAPNGITAQLLETHGNPVHFLDWLKYGLPAAIGGLWIAQLLLSRPKHEDPAPPPHPISQAASLSAEGKRTLLLLGLILGAWIVLPLPAWSIALGGGCIFFIPGTGTHGKALLTVEEGHHIPWGVLWLFGGGLALAQLLELSGLSQDFITYLTQQVGETHALLFLVITLGLIIGLTELFSNTALCALILPILLPLMEKLSLPPLTVIWIGIATSMAFMLPVATPPNALAYTRAQIPLSYMRKKGLWMNLAIWVWLSFLAVLYHYFL